MPEAENRGLFQPPLGGFRKGECGLAVQRTAGSIRKQEKMRWVAVAPTSCSQRPAMPTVQGFLAFCGGFPRVGCGWG